MSRFRRDVVRWAAVCAAAGLLTACGGLMEGSVFKEEFWEGSPFQEPEQKNTELGLASLAKGDFVMAQFHFDAALRADPRDVHALLGLGVIYQNTGQQTRAREMYEAVLAIRPDNSQQMVVWNNPAPQPVSKIASVNLALLDSGGVPAEAPSPTAMVTGSPIAVTGAPSGAAMVGRSAPPASQPAMTLPNHSTQIASAPTGAAARPLFADADSNIVARFRTLRDLRDQGLITAEEYRVRRQANVGALLPLTTPPPAAGIDRPVPASEQISGRLRAIGRALEMRAITVSQHAAERSMILDALMPAAPVTVANPGSPPQGLMEAADSVRRLERLKAEDLISSDEYTRERAAIEKTMQPEPPKMAAAAPAPAQPAAAPAASGGLQPAVHLASYRSARAAEQGWTQLRRAYGTLLDGLQPEVTRVNLGAGKGIYYRLKAGPMPSREAATGLCRRFKQRRQYCEPSFMGAG